MTNKNRNHNVDNDEIFGNTGHDHKADGFDEDSYLDQVPELDPADDEATQQDIDAQVEAEAIAAQKRAAAKQLQETKRQMQANTPVSIIAHNAMTRRLDELAASDDSLLSNARQAGLHNHGPHQNLAVDMIRTINAEITAMNQGLDTEEDSQASKAATRRRPLVSRLSFPEVALLLSRVYTVVRISPSDKNTDPDLDMLAVYDSDPTSPTYGTYQNSPGYIRQLARLYSYDMTNRDFAEVISALRDHAKRVTRGTDRDLIALNNCIFDYKNKKRIEFHPDHVFLSKAAVNYNPQATNVTITNPEDGTQWNVHDWIRELFFDEDEDSSQSPNKDLDLLIWQIIGAILRPYVRWNKSAFFYSEQGNNGKGTLIELMRNIIGPHSYASIPLSDFGKDFMLEPLTRASAILVDENDVGTYIDRAANLKAVITNDVISINRKYKDPTAYQFFGFMVQCLNESPQIRDRSESLYRRQLFVPFNKSFTGVERGYIKSDYIARDEVLEYIVYHVLVEMDDYYTLVEPEAAREALDQFKLENDPVRAFWKDTKDDFSWDLLPRKFLYDLYKAWLESNSPNSKPVGIEKFCKALMQVIANEDDRQWEWRNKSRPGSRLDKPEMMIIHYDLEKWTNERAGKSKPAARATLRPDQIVSKYSGLFRLDVED